jgi:hypothetical protein
MKSRKQSADQSEDEQGYGLSIKPGAEKSAPGRVTTEMTGK